MIYLDDALQVTFSRLIQYFLNQNTSFTTPLFFLHFVLLKTLRCPIIVQHWYRKSHLHLVSAYRTTVFAQIFLSSTIKLSLDLLLILLLEQMPNE